MPAKRLGLGARLVEFAEAVEFGCDGVALLEQSCDLVSRFAGRSGHNLQFGSSAMAE